MTRSGAAAPDVAASARREPREPSLRPSLFHTWLSVAAGVGSLVLSSAIASRPDVPSGARFAAGLLGVGVYVALVGPALERRWRLDQRWRHDPPDPGTWRVNGRAPRARPPGRPGGPAGARRAYVSTRTARIAEGMPSRWSLRWRA